MAQVGDYIIDSCADRYNVLRVEKIGARRATLRGDGGVYYYYARAIASLDAPDIRNNYIGPYKSQSEAQDVARKLKSIANDARVAALRVIGRGR